MATGGGDKNNKNKKYGRSKAGCKLYRDLNRREMNQICALGRHIKGNPEDAQARRQFDNIKKNDPLFASARREYARRVGGVMDNELWN